MASQERRATAPPAADSEDFNCNICFELLVDPVVGLCGHDFCLTCMKSWIKQQRRKRYSVSCPVCREMFATSGLDELSVCVRLRNTLERLFPVELAARRAEVRQAEEDAAAREAAAAAAREAAAREAAVSIATAAPRHRGGTVRAARRDPREEAATAAALSAATAVAGGHAGAGELYHFSRGDDSALSAIVRRIGAAAAAAAAGGDQQDAGLAAAQSPPAFSLEPLSIGPATTPHGPTGNSWSSFTTGGPGVSLFGPATLPPNTLWGTNSLGQYSSRGPTSASLVPPATAPGLFGSVQQPPAFGQLLPQYEPFNSTPPQYQPVNSTAPQYEPFNSTAPQYQPVNSTAPQYQPVNLTAPQYQPANWTAPQYPSGPQGFFASAMPAPGLFSTAMGAQLHLQQQIAAVSNFNTGAGVFAPATPIHGPFEAVQQSQQPAGGFLAAQPNSAAGHLSASTGAWPVGSAGTSGVASGPVFTMGWYVPSSSRSRRQQRGSARNIKLGRRH